MYNEQFDYKKLGFILKEARQNAKLTQKDIADRFNIKYQTVSAWENGKNKIDIETLFELCQIYEISFSNILELFSNEKNKAPTKYDLAEAYKTILHSFCGREPNEKELESFKNTVSIIFNGFNNLDK